MLAGITATSFVTLRDLVRVVLEVLRLLPLVLLAARVIMAVITTLPVADMAATLAVWSAVLSGVLAESQRRRTPAVRLLPLAACVFLARGLHPVDFRQDGVHRLQSNLRVRTLRFVSAGIGCAATSLLTCPAWEGWQVRRRPHLSAKRPAAASFAGLLGPDVCASLRCCSVIFSLMKSMISSAVIRRSMTFIFSISLVHLTPSMDFRLSPVLRSFVVSISALFIVSNP